MTNVTRALTPKPHTEALGIGLEADARATIATSLGEILSATYRLLIKTHVHHWNVVGPLFHPLHVMTEEQYNALFAATDVIAERIRALGHPAPIPAFEAPKAKIADMSAKDLVEDLIADHEAAVRLMRETALMAEEADDIVTNDMLVARMTFHEKAIWMLRAVVAA